jgi:23S rRNA G2445 N2-methylase RlmL
VCNGRPAELASLVVSPNARRIMETFTEGPVRYRLDFVAKGHQRGAVREIANRAYALCPRILNDARMALWAMDIHSTGSGESLELRPRWSPDPRFAYRRRDVPAASHPSLASSMAWLAGRVSDETVWDPFCGSGLELIERALRGGVSRIYGTDLSAEALEIARENFSASGAGPASLNFHCCDFRDWAKVKGLQPGSVGLIITNPPMGQRVPVPDLRGLISDLLEVAAVVLRPGGRLIFANPIRSGISHPRLRRTFRQTVDMGGFDCRLEVHVKTGGQTAPRHS